MKYFEIKVLKKLMEQILPPMYQLAFEWKFNLYQDHAKLIFANDLAQTLDIINDQKGIRVSLNDISVYCGKFNEEFNVQSVSVTRTNVFRIDFQFAKPIPENLKDKPFIVGPWQKDEDTLYEPDAVNQVIMVKSVEEYSTELVMKHISSGVVRAILMTVGKLIFEVQLYPLFIDACYRIIAKFPNQNAARVYLGILLLEVSSNGSEILKVLTPASLTHEARVMIGIVISPFSRYNCKKNPQKAFDLLNNDIKKLSAVIPNVQYKHELAKFYYNGCCVEMNESYAMELNKDSKIPLEKYNMSGKVAFLKSLLIGAIGFVVIYGLNELTN